MIEDFRGDTLVPPALLRALTKRIVENIHPRRSYCSALDLAQRRNGYPGMSAAGYDMQEAIAAVKRVRKEVKCLHFLESR